MRIILIALILLFVSGCSTQEGGSSLPWSQPEQWENDIGIGQQY